ncbi:unnamed protein product [Merluccius merluccius]
MTLCCPRPGHPLHPLQSLHTQRGQVELFPLPERHSKEEEQLEDEEDNKDEEVEDEKKAGAPLELMAEFLTSVMRRDLGLANRLCQMILLYEPENTEAAQFLPLIQQKVVEGELSDESDSESRDEDDHSGSNEGSSHDLRSSSSSSA